MRLIFATVALVIATSVFAAAPLRSPAPSGHWSLRPCVRPPVPDLPATARTHCRTPVDAFVQTRLRQAHLESAPEADRRTLIRRVTFDLTGLPPEPEAIDAFATDPAADAYERLVDRLLASPRYGERWGRHWLDVVRYAETEGFEYDRERPGAWRYRDYVIAAFQQDRPFDRFLTEQLAGDELATAGEHELHVAAGFHRLGPVRRNAGNPKLVYSRNEVLTEMTDAIGVVFLGLTVGCARCHDHMFDDIPQSDYYRLQAYLAATQEHQIILTDHKTQSAWKNATDRISAQIKKLRDSLPSLQGQELLQAEDTLRKLEQRLPAPLPAISTVRHVEAERTPIHVLKRGNEDLKGRRVGPRPLSAISPESPELSPSTSQPRKALARWLTQPDQPLTARVLVNRIWQHHFGTGLVETANDFGVNGGLPSHPELLDWLATEFREGGWRVRPIHRLIVLSQTYRQTSQPHSDHARKIDPQNRLLWRFPQRRLSAEEVRDAMLAVSGRLNSRMSGPGVVTPVEPDLVRLLYAPSQWVVTPDAGEHDRRSIYLATRRNLRLPFMQAFDQPDAQTCCARRESSTHALQALELLNGKLANDLAASFATRLRREAGETREAFAERAFALATGRAPNSREKEVSLRFLTTQSEREFALAMFNLNAFLYVD